MKDKDTKNLQEAFQLIKEAEDALRRDPQGIDPVIKRHNFNFSYDQINALRHIVDEALMKLPERHQNSSYAEDLRSIKADIEKVGDTPSMYQYQA